MNSYDKLRSIGVSVETADALAPILESLSPKKREAFYLWAMGYSYRAVAKAVGYKSDNVIRKLIKKVRTRAGFYSYIGRGAMIERT